MTSEAAIAIAGAAPVRPLSVPQRRAETMGKHSIVIAGHRTSISLEEIFWTRLKTIAGTLGISVNRLVERIDDQRSTNLSSAIRVFILQHHMRQP